MDGWSGNWKGQEGKTSDRRTGNGIKMDVLKWAHSKDVCFACMCSLHRRLSKTQDDKLT